MFEPFFHPLNHSAKPELGKCASISIDQTNRLVRREYKLDRPTVSRSPPKLTNGQMDAYFETELRYVTLLTERKSPFVCELIDYNEKEKWLMTRYYGQDLLLVEERHGGLPDLDDQLQAIFQEYRDLNFFKFNTSKANLALDSNGVLKAFDFKYCEPRAEKWLDSELYSILNWLPHSRSGTEKILTTFTDFSMAKDRMSLVRTLTEMPLPQDSRLLMTK